MNKKGMAVGGIVILFIGVIVAFALINPIANTSNLMTSKQSVSNQSIDVTTAYLTNETVNESIEFTIYDQSAWKQDSCPLTSVVIRNGAGTALADATDYVLDEDAGTFTLKTTAKTYPATSLNTTYADYKYCADGYNKDSSSRGIVTLIIIMSAMAIITFVLEKSGITNLTGR